MSTKTTDLVRVGIVGGGRIADLNKIGWLAHEHARIVAICDLNEARRQQRAAEWGCKAYPSSPTCSPTPKSMPWKC